MALRRRHLIALAAVLPAAACSSPNPNLYTLAPVPGRTYPRAPRYVEVRSITMPHYLERSEIVRSTEDYRLDVLPNDWWGESLPNMTHRVLIQDLNRRLPDSTVFSDTGAISATPDATVSVNVSRFDMNRAGADVLDADVAISGRHAGTRRVHLAVPVAGPGTPALVSAMSTAVGQLADIIAEMLVGASRTH